MPSYTLLNLFGAFLIGVVVIIWLVALRLSKADPSYFRTSDGSLHWWRPSSVNQVVRMIFDRNLPHSRYGRGVRNGIYIARVLYVLGIVGVGLFFYLLFESPTLMFPHAVAPR
jgi:hypothetical protein